MGLLDRHLTEIAERIMEHIDLQEVTKDVLDKLTVTDLEMYFVIRYLPDSSDPEFIGLAYSKSAAGALWLEGGASNCQILKLDIGRALGLALQAGIVEVVEECK